MATEQGTTRVVLVIDDNDADRTMVRRLLGTQRRRYELVEARTGEEGLRRALECTADCVLLDYHLPDMDGAEFLRRLSEGHPEGVPLPVAVMSGVEDDAAAAGALHAGAQDYVPKDAITGPHLARVVENAVEKFRIRRELEEQRAAVELRNHRLELLRDELQARMVELADATQAKDRFLAVMSHEMRTPLNAILGYTDLLDLELDGTLNESQRQHLDRMRVGSRHLLDLINDVLDITRADARKLEVDMRAVDLGAVVEEVLGLMEVRATAQGIQLVAEPLPANLPHVQADLQRLRQVLTNLVGNAIKFTDKGSVRVRCALEPDTGNVNVQVVDTGIGVEPEVMPLLFTEFYQAKDDLTRRHGGSGLGLAISQRLARAMGGDIDVQSVLGEGSTFTITLPPADVGSAERPQDVAQHDARMAHHTTRGQERTTEPVPVVAFSDDPATLTALQERVSPAVRLAWTTDPEQVPVLVERERSLLVILDIGSTQGATWRVAHAVAEAPLPVPPAILLLPMLVASRVAAGSDRSVDLGWVALVPKPFTADQLTNAVSTAAGRFSDRRRRTSTDDEPAYDVLVIDDDADSRRVASRFLADQGMKVRESVDGESGLAEMRLRPPDVTVLDLMMPVLDGFGVLAAMRADPLLASIPVVVLTAKTLTEAERQFLTRTAVRVLQKGEHRLADIASLVLRAAERAHDATREPTPGSEVI